MVWEGHDRRKSELHSVTLDVGDNLLKLVLGQIGVVSQSQKLDAIIEMLRAQASVPADLALAKEELSVVHEVINNLNGKVEEGLMGLKEDNATLAGKFDSMETAVTAVAEDISALKNELKEANERANIDLSPLITRAENIEAGLRASVGAQPGSDPEVSGDTGGVTAGGEPA